MAHAAEQVRKDRKNTYILDDKKSMHVTGFFSDVHVMKHAVMHVISMCCLSRFIIIVIHKQSLNLKSTKQYSLEENDNILNSLLDLTGTLRLYWHLITFTTSSQS